MKRPLVAALAIVIVIVALVWGVGRVRGSWAPDPEVIANGSLEGLREQNRLSGLEASYVAVVTARQSRFGLSAQRTLILPGRVRYEVDLGKLGPQDVVWDAGARRLDVTLPAIEIDGPAIDVSRMRAYDGGGLLLRFTDAGTALDAANRKAATAELIRQARGAAPMQIARDATRRAVERSFALPLRAAGLDATVRVRFDGEPGFPAAGDGGRMERSRSLKEVLGFGK